MPGNTRGVGIHARWATAFGVGLAGLVSLLLASGAAGAPGDATASQVADIDPGDDSPNNGQPDESVPASLFNAGGTLLFSANDGSNGSELWKSNGGPLGAGTEMAANINPGSSGSGPGDFTSVGDTVFFSASDGTSPVPGFHGREMWKIEPPYTTPVLVKDINPNESSSSPEQFTNVNGTVFFVANDGTTGDELWKSVPPYDAASTTPVANINAGGSSSPQLLTNVNGILMFTAADDGSDFELWKSDGTTTTEVEDISTDPNGSNPDFLTNVNGTLFFSADDGTTNGRELWKSAGPGYDAASTVLVENIAAGAADGNPVHLTNVNGTLFFQADDSGTNSNEELWKSTTPYTAAETVPIEINTGGGSGPNELVDIAGTLWFQASDGMNGEELWKSNGGAPGAGTDLVANIRPVGSSNPTDMTGVGGQVFFGADSDGVNGRELWKSTGVGATKVSNINATGDPVIDELTGVNGTLFFRANDGTTGRELWKATIEGPAPPPPPPLIPVTPTTPTITPTTTSTKKCKKGQKLKKGKCVKKKRKKKR
jgi:trimeric autotransporter adhesin